MVSREKFECPECQYSYQKEFIGICKNCKSFITAVAVVFSNDSSGKAGYKTTGSVKPSYQAYKIKDLKSHKNPRIKTNIEEFDRVLGGGFVEGEVVLLAGQPGAGKALHQSTLIHTPSGLVSLADVQVGDIIYDGEGKPTTILHKFYPNISKSYHLFFSDEIVVQACNEHLWEITISEKFLFSHKEYFDNFSISKSNVSSEYSLVVNTDELVSLQEKCFSQYNYCEDDFYITCSPVAHNSPILLSSGVELTNISFFVKVLSVLKGEEIFGEVPIMEELRIDSTEKSLMYDYVNNLSLVEIFENIELSSISFRESFLKEFYHTVVGDGYYHYLLSDSFVPVFKRVLFSLGVSFDVMENVGGTVSVLVNFSKFRKIYLLDSVVDSFVVGTYICLMVDSSLKTFIFHKNYLKTHNSSISMKISDSLARQGHTVLYSSGEESVEQVVLRAQRMSVDDDNIHIVYEDNLEKLQGYIEDIKPTFIVVDSLQTLASDGVKGSRGSISQSTEAAHVLTDIAKSHKGDNSYHPIILIINQIVKSGDYAGSQSVPHIVDATLMLESDKNSPLKLLRANKNRFGSDTEVGMFIHTESGLEEVSDPSGILLDDIEEESFGRAITFISEGIRQIPVEVQALVPSSSFANPIRQFTGAQYDRGKIVCAILDKFCKAKLYERDVFVNTLSGVRLFDPLADLAIASAILSSVKEKSFKPKTAFIGELSLIGTVKGSFMIDSKIREAERLGFENVIVPASAKSSVYSTFINIEYIKNIKDLESFMV